MIEVLIAGERDPAVLTDLARGVLRMKIPDVTLTVIDRFADIMGCSAGKHIAACPPEPTDYRYSPSNMSGASYLPPYSQWGWLPSTKSTVISSIPSTP